MPLTPEERRLRASIAGTTGWSNATTEERRARAKHASNGLYAKFLRQVDPDNTLPEAERHNQADRLLRLHYQRMRFASMKARRERKEAQQSEAERLRQARASEALGDAS